jgi:hypothetical protein
VNDYSDMFAAELTGWYALRYTPPAEHFAGRLLHADGAP